MRRGEHVTDNGRTHDTDLDYLLFYPAFANLMSLLHSKFMSQPKNPTKVFGAGKL